MTTENQNTKTLLFYHVDALDDIQTWTTLVNLKTSLTVTTRVCSRRGLQESSGCGAAGGEGGGAQPRPVPAAPLQY